MDRMDAIKYITICDVLNYQQAWSAVQDPLWYCVCIINSSSTLLN